MKITILTANTETSMSELENTDYLFITTDGKTFSLVIEAKRFQSPRAFSQQEMVEYIVNLNFTGTQVA